VEEEGDQQIGTTRGGLWHELRNGGIERKEMILQVSELTETGGDKPKSTSRGPES